MTKLKSIFIVLFLIFIKYAANAHVNCSSSVECEEKIQIFQEKADQLKEEERIADLVKHDADLVRSLRVPYMRYFAKDEEGQLLKMTYDEAVAYCRSRGLRLPSALEFILISRLGGAEISFLDKEHESFSDKRKFYSIIGFEVYDWSVRSIMDGAPDRIRGLVQKSAFYYHIPNNFKQKISAYNGAVFWSSTLVDTEHSNGPYPLVYTYIGDQGDFDWSIINRFPTYYNVKNSDGSYKRQKEYSNNRNAVVCSQPRK